MMWKLCLSCSFVYLVFVRRQQTSGSAEKRLLLNDPVHLQQEIDALKSRLQTLETARTPSSGKSRGDIFIHWGKRICNNSTSALLYSGYAGGSVYSQTGSSAKSLCLPPDPILTSSGTLDPNAGYIYGTEYEIPLLEGVRLQDEDVPCSVCISHPGIKVIMIPARNKCYDGWAEIYHGYLVGNYHGSAAAEDFVCLDKNLSFILGGGENKNGHIFHLQKTQCGSLTCPPYENDKFVTCAVCGII